MISVYDVGLNKFDGLGSCVLTPTKASHRQIAGGSYELTLEHPMDEGGKWQHLTNGAILKVPVPEETIEDAREGMEADIYRTVAEAELREEPSEPQQINYAEWNPSTSYTVGSKVTCSGWNHRNWKCTFYDESSPQTYVPPYNNNTWWTQIADYTSGSPVIVKLPAGETLYLVSVGEGWYQVITPYGVQGYIKADKVEFVKHVEPGEITSHVITEQLFRITEVDIDNEANKVTAKAQHVSYDLNGILCEDMEISQASAAMAISRIAQGLMMDYKGAIATNLTDTAGTYTQSIKGRNGGFCLLDPDRGVLPAFGAMLKRDNWDIFVMKKKHTDRGYRIRYGKNAKGINWQRKVQDLVTRVVPVAKNEDGSNLYLPEKWVDSTHIGDYPTIRMEWLRVDGQVGKDDGTGTDTVWTLENLYTEMRTKAGERYTVDKVDVPVEEVTVNFEQLGDSAEFAWLKDREQILLYDTIRAIDERIGLEMDLYVTELEYDAIRRKVTGVKLSNSDNYRERTVTGFNVQDNSITPRKLTDEVKDSFLQTAVGVMPNYANANTWKPNTASSEGYVAAGQGNNNKVWATNGSGEPAWRNPGAYTLPLAADGTRGGVQIGYTQSGKNYPVQLSGEKMFVNVPWTDHYAWSDITDKPATATRWPTWDEVTGKPGSFYTLPLAANGTRGGVQVGYSSSGKNYAVQLSGEKMYVNVPWTDTNGWPYNGIAQETTTDFNSLTTQGWYRTDGTTMTNGPAQYTWGEVLVFPYGQWVRQSGKFYIRNHTGNPPVWGSWVDLTKDTTYTAGTGLSLSGGAFSLKTGYTQSGKNYPVVVDSNGNPYVNVPWSQRPVVDNLTSTDKDKSLSANQGKVLNDTKYNKTGGIVYNSASEAPLSVKSNSGTPYIGFINSNDEYNGWLYITSEHKAGAYYNSGFHHLALESDAVKSISRSGTTFTATRCDGTTFTFTQQDSDTKNSEQLTNTALTWSGEYTTGDYMLIHNGETGSGGGALFRAINRSNTAAWVDNEHKWVRIGGDTMTGNLAVYKAGETYVDVKNTNTSVRVMLDSDGNGDHGIWSPGYWNGSAFTSSGKWLIYRNVSGNVLLNGSAESLRDAGNNNIITAQYSSGGLSTFNYACVWNGYQITYISKANMKSQIDTWRPVQDNLTSSTASTDSLSAKMGWQLANGWARDNRIQKIGLDPGASMTIPMRQTNSFYFVVWRIGEGNSGGIKVGHAGHDLSLVSSGTDNCQLTFSESGGNHNLIIKNTHASAYLRGFMFGNNSAGQTDVN